MTDLIKDDSRYLHGEDLQKGGRWCEFTLTIKSVGEKDSATAQDGTKIEGYPITFLETEKILVIKKTNVKLAKAALGSSSRKGWVGMSITLHPVKGDWFQQHNVLAVRVRVPEGRPRPFIRKKDYGIDITGETVCVSTSKTASGQSR